MLAEVILYGRRMVSVICILIKWFFLKLHQVLLLIQIHILLLLLLHILLLKLRFWYFLHLCLLIEFQILEIFSYTLPIFKIIFYDWFPTRWFSLMMKIVVVIILWLVSNFIATFHFLHTQFLRSLWILLILFFDLIFLKLLLWRGRISCSIIFSACKFLVIKLSFFVLSLRPPFLKHWLLL